MKTKTFSILMTLILGLAVALEVFTQPEFMAATFSGLRIGKATIADLRQLFGERRATNALEAESSAQAAASSAR